MCCRVDLRGDVADAVVGQSAAHGQLPGAAVVGAPCDAVALFVLPEHDQQDVGVRAGPGHRATAAVRSLRPQGADPAVLRAANDEVSPSNAVWARRSSVGEGATSVATRPEAPTHKAILAERGGGEVLPLAAAVLGEQNVLGLTDQDAVGTPGSTTMTSAVPPEL